ncbi:PREDICTED: uncharacterized protein LOC106740647 isoform X2 [Dinoponera quadriceps]|nr:PREDICTED: uncharacterized protein LOC106740647 isoform X2 [Dinoponera quadriceps]
MLLNTNFSSQYRLAEDTLHGHQVGLWPIMSPYLFIQIVWGLHCEELLPRFVLYVPLELSIEILSAIIPCLAQLGFERAVNLVTQLVNYMYKFIYKLAVTGTQVEPCEEYMNQLQANFQELLDQLSNPRVTRLPDLSEQLRYEHQGIILKNIVRMNKLCATERINGGVLDGCEKFYALTFGNEMYLKLPAKQLQSCINEMDQSLITLLINHLKEVNCHMYLAWAETDDRENSLLSLQRAIITECVYFGKVVQTDAKLQEDQELRTCLDQLIGSHKQPQLTLEEIYNGVQSGQLTNLKELLQRYQEWDESTLEFVNAWQSLLLTEDFLVLFRYLKHTFSVNRYTHQQKVYLQRMVMEIILKRSVRDLYDITLLYILHHYHDHFLMNLYDLYDLHGFYRLMQQSTWDNLVFLKSLLIHMLHSPKHVLTALIHTAVDVSNSYMCTPKQLLILRPFLCIKMPNDTTLLTEILYQMCMDAHPWEPRKYVSLIVTMLKVSVTSPEDILINVCIRYLMEMPYDCNVMCILTITCKIIDTYSLKAGVMELCLVVTRKISNWRKCEPTKKREKVNELVSQLLRVLRKCVGKQHLMTVEQKRLVLNTLLPHIEPLDKAAFRPLLYMMQRNVLTIVDDYARRCHSVRAKYKLARREHSDIWHFLGNIQLKKQDFIRHMLLHATDAEFRTNCLDITTKYWFFFGWLDEFDAYDNVTRITMEAIRITIEYPEEMPCDGFSTLLSNCMRFTQVFAEHPKAKGQAERILRVLLNNMHFVLRSTRLTQRWKAFDVLIKELELVMTSKTTSLLADFLNEVAKFIKDMICCMNDNQIDNGWMNDNQTSDNQISDNQMSDNQMSYNQISDNQMNDDQMSDNQMDEDQMSDNQMNDDQMSDNQMNDDQMSDNQMNDDQTTMNNAAYEINLPNKDTYGMFDSYKFICGCFSVPGTENHQFIAKLEEIMFTEDYCCLNSHPL